MIRTVCLVGAWLCVAFGAQAQDSALRQCRVLPDAAARLSCYDAIPLAAARPAAVQAAPAGFGFPEPAGTAATQTVQSAVGADFTGWRGRTQITLENGQVWEVVDGSLGAVGPANRKVVVRRAAFGSYRMEFEGLNNAPTVRRVK